MFTSLDPLHSYDPIEIIKQIFKLFLGGSNGASDWASRVHLAWVAFFKALPFYLINFFAKFIVFSFFFSLAMLILLIIYIRRYKEIREKMMVRILPHGGVDAESFGGSVIGNPKWEAVLKDIASSDPNKWKLAIIEADIILNDLLNKLPLPGEGIGEKLKAVERSDFDHLDQAWEAHKIRNAIAHGGSDFLLTQREAQRVIGLYKEVFNEFEMI